METTAMVSKTVLAVPDERWEAAGSLPTVVSVEMRARRFTLRDLLMLEAGAVLETADRADNHVPILANGELVAWGKFEVIGPTLGLRVTDIA
jgi:flagellar motor switch/type III secretory pathway protein FliN